MSDKLSAVIAILSICSVVGGVVTIPLWSPIVEIALARRRLKKTSNLAYVRLQLAKSDERSKIRAEKKKEAQHVNELRSMIKTLCKHGEACTDDKYVADYLKAKGYYVKENSGYRYPYVISVPSVTDKELSELILKP